MKIKRSKFGCLFHTSDGWIVTFNNSIFSKESNITLNDCLLIEYPFQDRVNYSAITYYKKKEIPENDIIWHYPFSEKLRESMLYTLCEKESMPERPLYETDIPSKLSQGVICMPKSIIFAEYINLDVIHPIIDALVFVSGFTCFKNPNKEKFFRMIASHSKMVDERSTQPFKNLFFVLRFGKSDLYNFWRSL